MFDNEKGTWAWPVKCRKWNGISLADNISTQKNAFKLHSNEHDDFVVWVRVMIHEIEKMW